MRCLLSLLLMISALSSTAQVWFKNRSNADSSSRQLFDCKENIVEVSTIPFNTDIRMRHSSVRRSGNYLFIRPDWDYQGDADTLTMYNNIGELISSCRWKYQHCREAKLPDSSNYHPESGKVIINFIIDYKEYPLIVNLTDAPILRFTDTSLKVIDYNFSYKKKDGASYSIGPYPGMPGALTNCFATPTSPHVVFDKSKAVAFFKSLKQGDKIYFDDIRVTGLGKEARIVGSLVITIP